MWRLEKKNYVIINTVKFQHKHKLINYLKL